MTGKRWRPSETQVTDTWAAISVVKSAADRGRLLVPHCWKMGVGIAASMHLCAASSCSPYLDFFPAELSESPLRRDLVLDDIRLVDGKIALPQRPGLGIELDRETIGRRRAD